LTTRARTRPNTGPIVPAPLADRDKPDNNAIKRLSHALNTAQQFP